MSSVPFSLLLRLLLSIWCYSRLSFSRFLNLFSLLFFSLDIFCWSPSKSMDPFSAFSNRLSSPPVKFSFSHYILFCCRVRIWFFVISVSALKIYLLIYGCHTLIVKTWFLYFFKHIIRVVWKFWLLNPTWVATPSGAYLRPWSPAPRRRPAGRRRWPLHTLFPFPFPQFL